MGKRLFDILFSLAASVVTLPIVFACALLIWGEDGDWPFYRGLRVGRRGSDFRMIKLRTMIADGERRGGSSTASSDHRLTKVGGVIRRLKLDELPQFWNVLLGDMSVVGPRPNFRAGGVDRYTDEEQGLLAIRPGITDLASIVFSDEGEILNCSSDPDGLYDAVIRPWKNRLGLLYVDKRSLSLDLQLIWLTAVGMTSRRTALRGVARILDTLDANSELKRICLRSEPLPAGLPPGVPSQLAMP
jgi:lipopolysaccharide/colanic/teichoic acid biosynthesis glycosyltransferase